MSMKTSETPRRIYVRNGATHVCFDGRTFAPTTATTFDMKLPIVLEKLESDGGRARVEATQRRPGKSTLTETWRSINVPRNPRA